MGSFYRILEFTGSRGLQDCLHDAFPQAVIQIVGLEENVSLVHARLQIYLVKRNKFGFHEKLVAQIGTNVDWDTNVSSNKGRDIPITVEKDVKPVEQGNDTTRNGSDPSAIWLEWRFVWKQISVKSLHFASVVKSKIGYTDTHPSQKYRDSGQVYKPIEDYRGT